MLVKVDRKVLIHIILIGIILTVVFLITLDLKKEENSLGQVVPAHQDYEHILDDLGI